MSTSLDVDPSGPLDARPQTQPGATIDQTGAVDRVGVVHEAGELRVAERELRGVRPRHLSFYGRYGKRALDLVLVLPLLVLVSPLLLATVIAVRTSLGRPVLFRQARTGRDGRTFVVLKLRTMHPDRRAAPVGLLPNGDPDRRITHKTVSDPRHTRLGRFLRASSLDELPQLLNVARGDMSLVGPRPELVHLAERYLPWQQRRHQVRPGLTGPWQLDHRATLKLHEAAHIDVDYVDRLSLRRDLLLLVRTPFALVSQRGS